MNQVDKEQTSAVATSEIETRSAVNTDLPLKHFTAGKRDLGFIEGPRGYIITEDDLIHSVFELDEPVDLNVADYGDEPTYRPFTLAEIRAIAEPIPPFRWIHYWGIKARIRSNYAELLRSMREVGADVDRMPKWGEGDVPAR